MLPGRGIRRKNIITEDTKGSGGRRWQRILRQGKLFSLFFKKKKSLLLGVLDEGECWFFWEKTTDSLLHSHLFLLGLSMVFLYYFFISSWVTPPPFAADCLCVCSNNGGCVEIGFEQTLWSSKREKRRKNVISVSPKFYYSQQLVSTHTPGGWFCIFSVIEWFWRDNLNLMSWTISLRQWKAFHWSSFLFLQQNARGSIYNASTPPMKMVSLPIT